jgi:hypothetical protein
MARQMIDTRHGNPFSAEAGGRGAKNDVGPNATAAGRKIC